MLAHPVAEQVGGVARLAQHVQMRAGIRQADDGARVPQGGGQCGFVRVGTRHHVFDLQLVFNGDIKKHVVGILLSCSGDVANGFAFQLLQCGIFHGHDNDVLREARPLSAEFEFILEGLSELRIGINGHLRFKRRIENFLGRIHFREHERPPQVHVVEQRPREYLRPRAAFDQGRDAVQNFRNGVGLFREIVQGQPGHRPLAGIEHELQKRFFVIVKVRVALGQRHFNDAAFNVFEHAAVGGEFIAAGQPCGERFGAVADMLATRRGAEAPRARVHGVAQQIRDGLGFVFGCGPFVGFGADDIGAQRRQRHHEREIDRAAAPGGGIHELRKSFPVPADAFGQHFMVDAFDRDQVFGQ